MNYLSKVIFVLAVSLLGVPHLFAQAPDTGWTRICEGSGTEMGASVQQTTDGGYVVAGYTRSRVTYLRKVNSSGDSLWAKIFSFSGGIVQETTDKGFIIAGAKDEDAYLIKTDSLGDSLWAKTYGDTNQQQFTPFVQQTSDGGYIAAGDAFLDGRGQDVYLIKTDSLGDTLWTKTYGGTNYDVGASVQQTTDAGYIIAASTYSFGAGHRDIYLIKTDSLGDTLWTKTFGGADLEYGTSVQQTTDGGYIVGGFTEITDPEGDAYLIKTDSLGDTLWTKTFGESGQPDDITSVRQTTDGGYIIGVGAAEIGSGYQDVFLIKTDSLGDALWTGTYGTDSLDNVGCVRQTSDGGYIVTGYTYYNGNSDLYLIKLKPEESGVEKKINAGLFHLSPANPNPFTSETTVRYELGKAVNVDISVYNMLGQRVRDLYSGRQASGVYSVSWDGSGNSGEKSSSGIYFLRIETGEKEVSTKVMFVR